MAHEREPSAFAGFVEGGEVKIGQHGRNRRPLHQAAGDAPGAVLLPGGYLGVQAHFHEIDQATFERQRIDEIDQAPVVDAVEKVTDAADGDEGAPVITQRLETAKGGFH
jgi:hypothetical protein